ncbi:alpha-tocopherol transfer protein-like [Amyelois transitella]|uniref:alpha-tocopherol transfer protein-like n=1 Tax=Amyelois transitella TaxID=680683 RepID=UPI00299000ED|nr:alpha-tocopherol transfer protein-like [Amyelois transitella]
MSVKQFPVQKEYEKNSHIDPKDIKLIQTWLVQQPHLPQNITDLEVILAYHSCESNIELTKRVIDLNYTLRTMFSFYSNRDINKSLEVAMNTWLITPLSTPTPKGHRAIYCQLLDEDPNKSVYKDAVRAFMMVMDLWQFEEGTAPGTVFIVNMDRVSLAHLTNVDVNVAQEFFYFVQEAMFINLKEFHFINAPSYIDKLLNLIKPLMKMDTFNLLKVHTVGSQTLEEYVPLDALPKEAGGNNKDSYELRDAIWNKIRLNKEFFEAESLKRVDESKRPDGPKTISSIFPSVEGSFKKLNID